MAKTGTYGFNPSLKEVLSKYQKQACKSLDGPSRHVTSWKNDMVEDTGMPFGSLASISSKLDDKKINLYSYAAMPLLLPIDNAIVDKSETVLEGVQIACFIVGGEKRLCLPQILNTVLNEFSLDAINCVCDELHIFCSRCNPNQLIALKSHAVVPRNAASCGLITKTDAERLCDALLHKSPEKSGPKTEHEFRHNPESFRVYHECFGKCKGIFCPNLYVEEHSKCIRCIDCCGLFTPQRFVCHSHKSLENRTCHWGFDSANWRCYLMLSKDQECQNQFQDVLDQMKSRFDVNTKKNRANFRDDSKWPNSIQQLSAFRPWSPSHNPLKDGKINVSIPQINSEEELPEYLHTGVPILVNPERVISFSDSNRYERHFAPNVSLAPALYQKLKEESEERLSKFESCDDIISDLPPSCSPKSDIDPEYDVSDSDSTCSSNYNTSQEKSFVTSSERSLHNNKCVDRIRRALKMTNNSEGEEIILEEFHRLEVSKTNELEKKNQEIHYLKDKIASLESMLMNDSIKTEDDSNDLYSSTFFEQNDGAFFKSTDTKSYRFPFERQQQIKHIFHHDDNPLPPKKAKFFKHLSELDMANKQSRSKEQLPYIPIIPDQIKIEPNI